MHRRAFLTSSVGGSTAALLLSSIASDSAAGKETETATEVTTSAINPYPNAHWFRIKAPNADPPDPVYTYEELRKRAIEVLQETNPDAYADLDDATLKRRLRAQFNGNPRLNLFGLFEEVPEDNKVPKPHDLMALFAYRWRRNGATARLKMIGLANSYLPPRARGDKYHSYLRLVGRHMTNKLHRELPDKTVDVMLPPPDVIVHVTELAARVRALPRMPLGTTNTPLMIREFAEADRSRIWEIDVPVT